ncbi:Protein DETOXIFICATION [Rhynchospora pubera]|uniref:Protein DETOXIFICATION n=1 Tax=Rhynchospora pubera TaxID=906938 RepID=A0AAV8EX59_9POAL|nr:Protein DETOXIFICATION [Rhynchospora pubera]
MDYSPLISKVVPSSHPSFPNTGRGTITNSPFEAALAQNDEESGSLIPASVSAGEYETVDLAADVVSDSPTGVRSANDVEKVKNAKDAWKVFVNESKVLWAIAAPIAFNIICLYGMNSSTQIFVGHIGNLELSAVAIALSVMSNFSFGFLLGMGSALETLCGQAFGAGQVSKLGVYMQRSWIILICSAILLCPLYIFSTPILRLLGQDEEIAVKAGQFTVWIIPQMFALAINFPTQKFLQSQSKVMVLSWIGFVALIIHIGLLILFIDGFGWSLGGAALAFNISSWITSISQVVYVVGWCKDGWTGLSWAAFNELWAFVKLSLASAIMLCLEIWYMMVLVVLTGHLDDAEIAVDSISICMNINGWEAMLFIGLNAAISVRVSNELGSGRPRATLYAVIVVVVQSLALGILSMMAILIFKNDFSVIFTDNYELQKAVAGIAHLLAITMVLNSIQPVISGVAVGGGWQGLVAYINLGCYYIFGLPFGFILGYVLKLGVEGIWMGMLCGTTAQTIILLIVVWRTNWKDEAAKALERVRLWGGQEEQKLQTEAY